ncbi:MAG: hypothetical protein ACRDPQ_01380 [Nocardioidaceae bacterium]
MSHDTELTPLSDDELEAQQGTALPDKEVVSILDLNADIALAIGAAAPIDLAVAANANVAAPIDAAVGANILSTGSSAQALGDQGVMINQSLDTDASANAVQGSTIDQGNDVVDDGSAAPEQSGTSDGTASGAGAPEATNSPTEPAPTEQTAAADPLAGTAAVPDTGLETPDTSSLLDGALLNVNVNLDADVDVAAPIDGAVAANANVAAPIDAAVAANVGSVDSQAVSIAQQDAIINQQITGSAEANAEQQSEIQQ